MLADGAPPSLGRLTNISEHTSRPLLIPPCLGALCRFSCKQLSYSQSVECQDLGFALFWVFLHLLCIPWLVSLFERSPNHCVKLCLGLRSTKRLRSTLGRKRRCWMDFLHTRGIELMALSPTPLNPPRTSNEVFSVRSKHATRLDSDQLMKMKAGTHRNLNLCFHRSKGPARTNSRRIIERVYHES